MTTNHRYSGIEGLRGREPIGARISIGRKTRPGEGGRVGVPREKDRWHILEPRGRPVSDGGRTHEIREGHPLCRDFNSAGPEWRRIVTLELVHARLEDAFNTSLAKQTGPRRGDSPPSQRPWCSGDGRKATRFGGMRGSEEVWREITCPNEQCEFRQGSAPSCKPYTRLLARLRWPAEAKTQVPPMMVEYVTRAWSTTSYLKGMFDRVRAEAAELGITEFSWHFLLFQLQVQEHTKSSADGGRRFPVVHATLLVDVPTFLLSQSKRAKELQGFTPLALTDAAMNTPAKVARDLHSVSGGRSGIDPSFPGEAPPEVMEAEVVDPETEALAAEWEATDMRALMDKYHELMGHPAPANLSKADMALAVAAKLRGGR